MDFALTEEQTMLVDMARRVTEPVLSHAHATWRPRRIRAWCWLAQPDLAHAATTHLRFSGLTRGGITREGAAPGFPV